MAQNTRKLVGVILMLAMLVAAIAAITVTASAEETATFVKVTEAPSDWSGTYLIVYEGDNVAFDGSRTTLDATFNTHSVTISDGSITSYAKYAFTIAAVDEGYTIQSASGYYVGQSSNANGLKSSKSTTYVNTISLNDDDTVNFVSGGAYLRYNSASDQARFRYYKSSSYSGQKAICLYKLDENAAGCSHTETIEITTTSCTEAVENGTACKKCGAWVGETTTVPATGHNFKNNVCANGCGEKLYTATFVSSGVEVDSLTSTVNDDHSINHTVTLPGVSDTYTGKTFAGWATASLDEDTTNAPTLYDPDYEWVLKNDTTFYAVYTYDVVNEGTTTYSYVLTDLADIKATDVVVITMTYEGTVYALNGGNGSSAAPAATILTVSGNSLSAAPTDNNLLWNIANDNGNITIYPNGKTDTWLYCTNSNNGVRVGTNANKVFTIDATSGYLKNTATSRYLGVYRTNPDWRCYTNTTGNTAGQTLGFYVQTATGTGDVTVPYYTTLPCVHSVKFDKVDFVDETPVAVYACETCGNTYNRSVFTFEGGSIRYAEADGTDCPTDAVDIRFGYTIDPNVLAWVEENGATIAWGWTYTAGGSTQGSKEGSYITADGNTNLVFTNVSFTNLATDINVTFSVTITVGDEQGTVTDDAQTRNTVEVLEMTALDERAEFAAAAAYAKKVLYAYDDEKYVAYAPSINEEENA